MTNDDHLLVALSHHALVSEAHRLALFTIPKVGCTELIKLMRRLAGAPDWDAPPHYQPDRPFLRKLGIAGVSHILNDPAWTTAAVFRDPAERLLSAYLDKFVLRGGYAENLFRPRGRGMPFDEFLSYVLAPNDNPNNAVGLHVGTDPHWRPQHLVGGVGLVRIDLAGDFVSIGVWIERVLRHVGAWEEFGATGWGPDGDSAIFEHNNAPHRTDAARRMSEFYDADALRAVYEAYSADVSFGRSLGLDLMKYRRLLAVPPAPLA